MFFTKLFLFLLSLCFFTVSSHHDTDSFSFKKFDKKTNNSLSFLGNVSLYHNQNGSFIQIINSGSISYKKPVYLFDSNPTRIGKVSSFTTYFVLSISPETRHGNGLSFVVKTNGSLDPGFRVSFDGVFSKFKKMNDGKKLQCWIDFQLSARRVEIRVCAIGEARPVSPLFSRVIELVNVFDSKRVYVGLEARNLTGVLRFYSWSFKLRNVPNWMHSQPLDPEVYKKDTKPIVVVLHKRNDCVFRVFTALVFGTGCGALGAFIVLCVCRVFVTKKPASVAPEVFVVQPVKPGVFDCDKAKIIIVDKYDDVKK